MSPPTPALAADHASGVLEIRPEGYGFLRTLEPTSASIALGDIYVASELIRKLDLREGITISGPIQASVEKAPMRNGDDRRPGPRGRDNRRPQQQRRPMSNKAPGPRLVSVETIEGADPELYKGRPSFDRLTPIDPRKWLNLETNSERLTTRVMDMFTPIGKGTRGLIVAPPRTGKTILLQHIADSISTNHPDCELIVLLIDERPEEVTELKRAVNGKVYASSNDRETANHVRLAQLVIERAKRMVECGRDVVVLLDSITRLARAFNKHVGTTGRTMSGGLDVKALDIPKRLFGSARAFDEGGSLTVMATALIETGSRMDDVIFQEFKGTGNMELVLDRKLADRRVFPAIDLLQSGTRKEERLLSAESLERITLLRRSLMQMNHVEAMESLTTQLKKYPTNNDFLTNVGRFTKPGR